MSQDIALSRTLIAIIEPVQQRRRSVTYQYAPMTIEAVPVPSAEHVSDMTARPIPFAVRLALYLTYTSMLLVTVVGAGWLNLVMLGQLLGTRPLW